MPTLGSKRVLALLPAIALALPPTLPAPPAASRVAGTATMTYTQRAGSAVGDAEGHMIGFTESKGTNRSTGPTEYMAGGQVANAETSDLVNGNGPHQGYITFTGKDGSTVSRWSGKVTTTLDADKRPVTTFEGTWTLLKGTGRFEGATGNGSYRGRITSENAYTVDWQGEISAKGMATR